MPLTLSTTIGHDLQNAQDQQLWHFLDGHPPGDLLTDHLPPFYFIIDEINRAELSRVLGEIMFALEYRGAEYKIRTQYSSLISAPDDPASFLFSEGTDHFFIPHNLRLIGTMNVIDRSVESFDFALRRRFRWRELVHSTSTRCGKFSARRLGSM